MLGTPERRVAKMTFSDILSNDSQYNSGDAPHTDTPPQALLRPPQASRAECWRVQGGWQEDVCPLREPEAPFQIPPPPHLHTQTPLSFSLSGSPPSRSSAASSFGPRTSAGSSSGPHSPFRGWGPQGPGAAFPGPVGRGRGARKLGPRPGCPSAWAQVPTAQSRWQSPPPETSDSSVRTPTSDVPVPLDSSTHDRASSPSYGLGVVQGPVGGNALATLMQFGALDSDSEDGESTGGGSNDTGNSFGSPPPLDACD